MSLSCNTIWPTTNSANSPQLITAQDNASTQLDISANSGRVMQIAPYYCFLPRVSADRDVPLKQRPLHRVLLCERFPKVHSLRCSFVDATDV